MTVPGLDDQTGSALRSGTRSGPDAGPGPGLPSAGPGAGPCSGTGLRTAQDCPGRSALMASPDGVGWPEVPAGYSLGATWDESRFTTAGLGWPSRKPETGQPAPGVKPGTAKSGHDAARSARNVSGTGEDGQ